MPTRHPTDVFKSRRDISVGREDRVVVVAFDRGGIAAPGVDLEHNTFVDVIVRRSVLAVNKAGCPVVFDPKLQPRLIQHRSALSMPADRASCWGRLGATPSRKQRPSAGRR